VDACEATGAAENDMNYVTVTLLAAFVIVFLGTALVTLLGIAGRLPAKDKYLNMFAAGLLLEVAGAMIWAFRSQDLSSTSQKFYKRVESVDVSDISPQSKTADEKLDALLVAKGRVLYRVWRVTGKAEFQDSTGHVNYENVYVNPVPFVKLHPNGTFAIDVLEQAHGDTGMEIPDLVIDQSDPSYGYGPEYIELSATAKAAYKTTKNWSLHKITVDEPVKLKRKTEASGKAAPTPVQVFSAPPPPAVSAVTASPSPTP
jgi:hypothetical protein